MELRLGSRSLGGVYFLSKRSEGKWLLPHLGGLCALLAEILQDRKQQGLETCRSNDCCVVGVNIFMILATRAIAAAPEGALGGQNASLAPMLGAQRPHRHKDPPCWFRGDRQKERERAGPYC